MADECSWQRDGRRQASGPSQSPGSRGQNAELPFPTVRGTPPPLQPWEVVSPAGEQISACMQGGGGAGVGAQLGRRPGGRTGEVHGCFSPVASEGHVCHGSREDNELPVRTPVSVVSAHRGARTHHKYFLAP